MKLNKKIIISVMLSLLMTTFSMTTFAMTDHFNDASGTVGPNTWNDWKAKWETIKTNLEQVALTPGEDQTKLNFGWYSHTANSNPSVKWGTKADMSDAKTFTGTQRLHRIINGIQYYSSKVTVSGLSENKTYYYQYENNGVWSAAVAYKTKSFSAFKVLFVGDPQIGASVGRTPSDSTTAQTAEIAARNDTYNWNSTLNTALTNVPDISFMISAGDQINDSTAQVTTEQEIEYSGYLSADALKSLPEATTIGNHDSTTTNYKNHFNNPNTFIDEKTPTAAGNDYYYAYSNALFMDINTNNYNCADHEALIKKAITAYPNAKWRILAFHQDIYGSGKDHSDSDGIVLRTQLTPIIDKYHIDVVLQGHDHSYTRTYQLSGDNQAHTAYSTAAGAGIIKWTDEKNQAYLAQNQCYSVVKTDAEKVTNPTGTLYVTANSSTGSKYYELLNPMQNYVAARWQEWKPTYSIIEISNTEFTISTYETESGKKIDTPYTIVKTSAASKIPSNVANKTDIVKNNLAITPKVSSITAEISNNVAVKEGSTGVFSSLIKTIENFYNWL